MINLDKTIKTTQNNQQQSSSNQILQFSQFQQWFIAAVNNNKNYIQEHKQFLKQTDDQGNTALMYAIKEGNNDLIPLLKDEIGCQNAQGFTALMFAISVQNNDVIEQLIDEVHIITQKKLSALHIAAVYNNVQAVKLLCQKLAGLMSKTGQTALMIAASLNHLEIFKILMPYEIKMYTMSKLTPLMFAAQSGSIDIVRYIIINDPDQLNKEDIINQTALIKTFYQLEKTKEIESEINRTNIQFKLLQVIKALIPVENKRDGKTGTTVLQFLAKFSANSLITDEMIQREGKMQNKQQMSALMFAAISNSTILIERLIEHEVGLQDENGYTALIHALINQNLEAASILLANESDIFDKQNNTPLMYACKYGIEEVVMPLLSSQLGLFNQDDESALFYAVQNDNSQFIQLLAPLIDQIDKNGNTALHKAAQFNAKDSAAQLLLYNNKLIQSKNNDNFTPIDIAANSNNPEVLGELLSYPHAQCNWLFSAIISDSWRVVKFAIDGARSGVISSQTTLNYQQQQECNVQLQQLTQDYQGYPDGFSCLLLAIYTRSFNSASLLYFVPQQPNKLNITPLMLLALQDCQQVPDKLLGLLIKRYAGEQLSSSYAGLQIGMTALMIACSVNEINNKLIELLAPIESDILDNMGRKAIDYCNVGDKDEQIRNLVNPIK